MARSSSNMNSASARASSVFPTPVGPRKMKEPIGRFGSCRPERARRSAFATASTACSWPTTRWCKRSSMWMSFSTSPSSRRETGIPVHEETTAAMSSSSTSSFTIGVSVRCSRSASSFSSSGRIPYWISATRARLPATLFALCLHAQLVDLTLDVRDALEGLLLARPARGELVAHGLRIGELTLDRLPDSLGLVRHRGELDLELPDAPIGLVELDRRRVDLHAQP